MQRTVKIKYVNEAWTHAPGSSRLEVGDHYRSGSNIWIENDDIQRISCYLVEKGGGTLSEQDINELAAIAKAYGKSENEIAFLAEERLLYRITLSHLERHFGVGLVSVKAKSLDQLDYWDQQSRKLMTQVRKDIKAKGRQQYMKDEDEKAKLALAASKLIKIESTYRRNFEVLPNESLDENPHYLRYLNEQMKEQKFPQDIIDQVNGQKNQ